MKFIRDIIKGILIGSGAILPGISSGVLCVIFGIYDKLVESVLGIFKDFKKNFLYLLPIVVGVFIGVILFGNILRTAFEKFPMQTKYLFIGLILGSVPILMKKINREKRFRLHYLIYTIVAMGIGIFTVVLEKNISLNVINISVLEGSLSYVTIGFLILAGSLMSIGIVVPGVSSTIILMCIGIYNVYINAISIMDISILIPIGIGVVSGGVVFLKIINYLLKKYYMQTFYSIIGFTIGSVFVLYMPISWDLLGLASIILLIIGFYIASIFENLSN